MNLQIGQKVYSTKTNVVGKLYVQAYYVTEINSEGWVSFGESMKDFSFNCRPEHLKRRIWRTPKAAILADIQRTFAAKKARRKELEAELKEVDKAITKLEKIDPDKVPVKEYQANHVFLEDLF